MDWNELAGFYGFESVDDSEELKNKICERFNITEPFLFTLYEVMELTKVRSQLNITPEIKTLISTVETVPGFKKESKYLEVKGNQSVLRLLKEIASEINLITNKNPHISFHHNKMDFVISYRGKAVVRFEKLDRYEYQFLYGNVVIQGVGQDIVDQLKSGSNFKKLKGKWVLVRVTGKVLIQIIRELNDIRFFERE